MAQPTEQPDESDGGSDSPQPQFDFSRLPGVRTQVSWLSIILRLVFALCLVPFLIMVLFFVRSSVVQLVMLLPLVIVFGALGEKKQR